MMEDAHTTLEFLENMSAIFRYNIRPLDKMVTVEDELSSIKAYAEMMKVRFGEKLKFELSISDAVHAVPMMPLILQPIVENAFIHGVGKNENGGSVTVKAWREGEKVFFLVKDNGVGMTPTQINRIINENGEHVLPKKSHSSGIGAGNVLQRLKLAYGDGAFMHIESTIGIGTEITIVIPWVAVGEDIHV